MNVRNGWKADICLNIFDASGSGADANGVNFNEIDAEEGTHWLPHCFHQHDGFMRVKLARARSVCVMKMQ